MKVRTQPFVFSLMFVYFILCLFKPVSAGAFNLDDKVIKHTLANGLTVLVLERPLSPTISMQIRHRVGAVDEAPGKTGLAHFLEHMLFKGTRTIGTKNYGAEQRLLEKVFSLGKALDDGKRKRPPSDPLAIQNLQQELANAQKEADAFTIKSEIDRLYSENGAANSNAATGQDLTTYYVSLPANKFELWARIESDRMMNPVFREFYSERNVIREERRQTIESNPSRILMEQFLKTAFSIHPYGRPVIGLPEDMEFLDIDDLRNFFTTYYAPNNTVIAVAGAISASAAISTIESYFGKIPAVDRPLRTFAVEPPQTAERRISVSLDAKPEILIGYHKPNLPDPDNDAFDIIEAILSSGRTSRLYRSLVEKEGLVQRINAVNGLPGNRFPNLFVFTTAPRDPHTVEEVEAGIDREIENLKQTPVSESELSKVKNQIRMDFLQDLDSNAGIAEAISYTEVITGDYRYLTRRLNAIEKITADKIMQTARKYLTKENRTVAVLSKTPQRGSVQ